MSMTLPAGTVHAGRQFEVRVSIGANATTPVDTVQVFLEFNPAALQVESVSPGPRLEYHLHSTWNNTEGRVAFAAGTLGPAANSPFTLCRISFRAVALAENTTTRLRHAGGRRVLHTKVILRGLDVTGSLHPLEFDLR